MNPRLILACFLAGMFALGLVAWGVLEGGEESPSDAVGSFAGARMPDGVRAPQFELVDERERTVAMNDFRGEPVIVTFLYTDCDETCPPAAQQVRGALDELGYDVPALAIAVDPPRDTPDSARAFLAEQRMLGRMRFLVGSHAELEPVWRGFAVRPQSPTAEHQGRIVLVDARGYQRVGYPVDQATPERIAHDVRLLEAD